jgi:DNA polymerase I-like protein with 3'-5' exonuclease and polymerase domains
MSLNSINYLVTDVETTTHNKGHPFDPRNKLVSYATLLAGDSKANFKYHNDPSFAWSHRLLPMDVVVGFNFKFDLHWLNMVGLDRYDFRIWDCQLAEHVYTGQRAQFISLDECLAKYGLETKLDLVKDLWNAGVQTDEIDPKILEEYNCWDVQQTEALFLVQQELLSDEQKALVYLLGEDLKVLASIEASGLVFDKERAAKELVEYKASVVAIEHLLQDYLPPISHGIFNWDSGDHLSCLLYGGTIVFDYATSEEAIYKSGAKKGQPYTKNSWHKETVAFVQHFKPLEGSEVKKSKDKVVAETRFYQVDIPTLSSLKGSKEGKALILLLLQRSEKTKLVEMLESLFKQFNEKQWEHNLVHGQYNQNVAVTGRLSSSAPNMQNIPPEIDLFFISRYAD